MDWRTPCAIGLFFAYINVPLFFVSAVIGICLQLGDKQYRLAVRRETSLQKIRLIPETNSEILQRRPACGSAMPEGESVIYVEKETIIIRAHRNEIIGDWRIHGFTEVDASRPLYTIHAVRFPNVFAVFHTSDIFRAMFSAKVKCFAIRRYFRTHLVET